MPLSRMRLCFRTRGNSAKRPMTLITVAVRKYTNAEVVFSLFMIASSCAASDQLSGAGTARTERIWAIGGSTPATACPVMIACIYSGLPKPAANAKAPFWHKPVAQDVEKTMMSVKVRYPLVDTSLKYMVDIERSVKTSMLIHSADMIRFG